MPTPRPLELLAPARDLATARQAILHGADAVYIGAPSHGARSKAANTLDDIAELVAFAAPFGVKVYVTVNTIIYDHELADVEQMVRRLYEIGVDALIVQDMALLEMDIPPIPLHASTQCDTRTPEKARFLADAGFSQIVVARELSLRQLREICQSVDVPVETFVHGALCVSYSGDCRASLLATGRSANRGCCAQMCRLPYDLIDGRGRVVGRQKHYLSLRDMNRIDRLAEMADAGVSSFKIEGRLKDVAYVKDVVASYRMALDRVIDAAPHRYCRASKGRIDLSFEPSLTKSFNREFTDYFLDDYPDGPLNTPDTPKAKGEKIGSVTATSGCTITAAIGRGITLNNGDGLTWITPDGTAGGGRINRVDRGSRLIMASAVSLPRGTTLYRSYDIAREAMLARPTARRIIDIDLTLREAPGQMVVLEASTDFIAGVAVAAVADISDARNDGVVDYRQRTLSKFGDTIFNLRSYRDLAPQRFIPASTLTELRRRLADALLISLTADRRRDIRRPDPERKPTLTRTRLTERDNVANSLARRFYTHAGATDIRPALELLRPAPGAPTLVMNTRFCLRRELGACLRCGGEQRLPGPLTLRGAGVAYRLDFDCRRCEMNLYTTR